MLCPTLYWGPVAKRESLEVHKERGLLVKALVHPHAHPILPATTLAFVQTSPIKDSRNFRRGEVGFFLPVPRQGADDLLQSIFSRAFGKTMQV